MEDYQIHTTSSVETDYEVQEINFEDQIDSREVVIDLEALEQCDEDNTLVVSSSVITTTTHQSDAHKRRYSFVWQYFHPVSSNQFECILCQSIVGNQTSNLSRHLDTAHGINNQREEVCIVQTFFGFPIYIFIYFSSTLGTARGSRAATSSHTLEQKFHLEILLETRLQTRSLSSLQKSLVLWWR